MADTMQPTPIMSTPDEGLQRDGSWKAPRGSHLRSLTAEEVNDLRYTAERTTPSFEPVHVEEVEVWSIDAHGQPQSRKVRRETHNTPWEQHHPIAQEIWERRGLKPKA